MSLREGEREGQARESREAGSQPRLLLHPCPPRPGHTLAPEAPSGRAECSQGGQLYRKVHGFQSGSDISWATILRVYLTLAFTFLVCKMGKASRRAVVRATQEKLCMVFTDVWPTGGLSNDSPRGDVCAGLVFGPLGVTHASPGHASPLDTSASSSRNAQLGGGVGGGFPFHLLRQPARISSQALPSPESALFLSSLLDPGSPIHSESAKLLPTSHPQSFPSVPFCRPSFCAPGLHPPPSTCQSESLLFLCSGCNRLFSPPTDGFLGLL